MIILCLIKNILTCLVNVHLKLELVLSILNIEMYNNGIYETRHINKINDSIQKMVFSYLLS